MTLESSARDDEMAGDWDPRRQLRSLQEREVDLSRGFLRCRPEKWFPAFAAHWVTLGHSLGVEMQIIEVKPALRAPRSMGAAYYGEALGERLLIFSEAETTRTILSSVTPGAIREGEEIVLEYLARRFLASLGMSWSGPKDSRVTFNGKAETLDMNEAGAVKLAFTLNNQACAIWILLGNAMIEQLDGLWRRQIQSSSRVADESQEVKFELGHVALPQSELSTALRAGGFLALDSFDPESAILRRNDRSWLPARLAVCGNVFAVETLAIPVLEAPVSEKSARVSVILGSATLESAALSELTQPGAIFKTDVEVSNRVEVLVNGRQTAGGSIVARNGRFSVRIA